MENNGSKHGIEQHLNGEGRSIMGSHLRPDDFQSYSTNNGAGWSATGLSATGSVVTYRIAISPEAVGRQQLRASCFVNDNPIAVPGDDGGFTATITEWYDWIRTQDMAGNEALWANAISWLATPDPRNQPTRQPDSRDDVVE